MTKIWTEWRGYLCLEFTYTVSYDRFTAYNRGLLTFVIDTIYSFQVTSMERNSTVATDILRRFADSFRFVRKPGQVPVKKATVPPIVHTEMGRPV